MEPTSPTWIQNLETMKEANKISIQELHQMLNARAGRVISNEDLTTLLACWRRARKSKKKGRQGWLAQKDADDFLRYAY